MMMWLTQPNEQKKLVDFLKNNSENIKLKYPNKDKPIATIYKFKKENSKNPADDVYVLFPHKTCNTNYNLYYNCSLEHKARKNAFKNIINYKDKDKIIKALSGMPAKKTYKFEEVVLLEVLSVLQDAKKNNLDLTSAIKRQYKHYNLKWHQSRQKVNLAFIGFQIKNEKLKEFSIELCIKKMCYSKEYMKQEIKYMKMFGCYAGYKPQKIYLNEDDYRVVILMKYLGESLNKHMKNNYFANNDKTKIIYEIAIEIKKMHDKNIVHGDLKPANITIDNNKVHIIDYDNTGLVGSLIDPNKTNEAIDSAYPYWPLFVLNRTVKRRTKAFDIFSFGVIIWEIYGGDYKKYQKIFDDNKYERDYPVKYKKVEEQFKKLIEKNLKTVHVGNKTIELVQRMISINYKEVPSIDEVIKHFAPKP